MNPAAGQLVLAIHLLVIAFNVLGLVAVLLGGKLGWAWVRIRWWRALHLVSWLVVALQAALGRACFLTDWQAQLAGDGAHDPLIARTINGLIYWDLPMWVFGGLYLALFALVAWLWRAVSPRPSSARR